MLKTDQLLTLAEAAPCDHCVQRAKCRINRLACAAFARYLDGAKQARWSVAPRIPTRARFVGLLDERSAARLQRRRKELLITAQERRSRPQPLL